MLVRSCFLLVAIVCAAMFSCGRGQQHGRAEEPAVQGDMLPDVKGRTVADFGWMAGWWQMPVDSGFMFEEWTPIGDILSGRAGEMDKTDTALSETISIRLDDSAILYIPVVKGQNGNEPVIFRLTYYSKDSFIFSNPHHDFPQTISYHRLATDTVAARIAAVVDGKEKSARFVMHRKR